MNGLSVYSGSSDASLRSRFTQICARLGADVVRYSFIVVDLHHLLLASLPAHLCKNAAAPKRSRITFGQITVKDAKISQACSVLFGSRNIILATFQIFAFSHMG